MLGSSVSLTSSIGSGVDGLALVEDEAATEAWGARLNKKRLFLSILRCLRCSSVKLHSSTSFKGEAGENTCCQDLLLLSIAEKY